MNRRSFLKLVSAGLPAVAVAEKIGLIERVRSYFFAPKGGWKGLNISEEAVALQLEKYKDQLPRLYDNDHLRAFVISLRGIPYYADVSAISGAFYGISRRAYSPVDFKKALLVGRQVTTDVDAARKIVTYECPA
jgi:hypothetical protein